MRKVLSALAVLASSSGVSSERETFLQLVSLAACGHSAWMHVSGGSQQLLAIRVAQHDHGYLKTRVWQSFCACRSKGRSRGSTGSWPSGPRPT